MTSRGRLVLGLGGFAYVVAWAFGSKPLYPVATGFLAAVALAWGWTRLANKPMRLYRVLPEGDHVEGDDLGVSLEVELEGRVEPPSLVVHERMGRLGERRTLLRPDGKRRVARYELLSVPRGRYAFPPALGVIEDPFGLQRIEFQLGEPGVLVVYPRLVELDRLFSDSGSHALEGRRMLLRRPTGFDLHSVREYEHGESLRRVHWPSTARCGQLMVKELEDAPRDETAVLLDAAASAVVGDAPDSSFDMQVRAAGSILKAHARRGRKAVLVVNSAQREAQRVASSDGDWRRALDLLAGIEPSEGVAIAPLLSDDASPASRAIELTVVTARLDPELVERLVQRAGGRRRVSLVFVDPSTFAGRASQPRPALLRLEAAGVPVAVLRRGEDLAAMLSGPTVAGVASA